MCCLIITANIISFSSNKLGSYCLYIWSLSKLCRGVSKGDHLEVKRALQDGENPNSHMPWEFNEGWGGKREKVPVLLVALHKRSKDVTKLLLEAKNIQPDYRGDFRGTPLFFASAFGYVEEVELLLKHGAYINAVDSNRGQLPIHTASGNGHVRVMQLLYAAGSRIDCVDNYGNTPLHGAAYWGRVPAVNWLLRQGADISALNHKGRSPLDHAKSEGHAEIVELLQNWKGNVAPMALQVRKKNKRVYILNYIDFPKRVMDSYADNTDAVILRYREGASKDSENLSTTFWNLGYDVSIHENKTFDQTNIILDYIQQDRNSEFLLLFVLSHGLDDHTFYTSDGLTYSLKNIQQRFTDSGCPQLKGSAKVLIANFCRGKIIENLVAAAYSNRDSIETDAILGVREPPHHMITIHAAHDGFAAMRNTKKGTVFVHNMCEVIREKSNLPIQDTFNEIFERIAQTGGQTPEMVISAPFPNFRF